MKSVMDGRRRNKLNIETVLKFLRSELSTQVVVVVEHLKFYYK